MIGTATTVPSKLHPASILTVATSRINPRLDPCLIIKRQRYAMRSSTAALLDYYPVNAERSSTRRLFSFAAIIIIVIVIIVAIIVVGIVVFIIVIIQNESPHHIFVEHVDNPQPQISLDCMTLENMHRTAKNWNGLEKVGRLFLKTEVVVSMHLAMVRA